MAFAVLALVLGGVGVYGMLSYVVALRRQEIGVKLAFGAGVGRVEREFVGRGVRLGLIGVLIGGLSAFGASVALDSLLYGVGRADVATYAASSGLLVVVVAMASWLPARRAAVVDPSVTLREE